ncbi:hypothetical protein [Solimonas sp. SE-A11]|uniref:hypothetical protein n=1 Tax=Solimonas sp. SE-A11 TaxID=3054954 RepID=UPI00259CF9EF|nr:hypothetical protein [Solimonas sp. SE-A11]MDM4768998.1 hypothetical protein [Solimonas sp. SE-A11]
MKFIKIILAAFLSTCLFVLLSASGEFVVANFISSRPALSDQQAFPWLLTITFASSPFHFIPQLLGGLLSWPALREINAIGMATWAFASAVADALLSTILVTVDLSLYPAASLLLTLCLPLTFLVIAFFLAKCLARFREEHRKPSASVP